MVAIVFVVVILLIDVAVFPIDVVDVIVEVIGCPKFLFCFAIFSIIKIT